MFIELSETADSLNLIHLKMASKRVRQASFFFETLTSAKRNCQHHSEEDDHSLNCLTQTSGDAGSSIPRMKMIMQWNLVQMISAQCRTVVLFVA